MTQALFSTGRSSYGIQQICHHVLRYSCYQMRFKTFFHGNNMTSKKKNRGGPNISVIVINVPRCTHGIQQTEAPRDGIY